MINVRHPEEARLLLGLKTNLTAGAVATVADGLPMPSGQRYIPRPAVSEQQLVGPMLSKGWGEELAISAVAALTFLLRVPSGRFPFTRQRAGESAESEERLDRGTVIRLAGRKLIAKQVKINHVAAGSRLVRI